MRQIPYQQGKFIVIEGLDGAGTTTQIRLLSQWLRDKKGYRVYITHEPSEGPVAKWLRQALQKRIAFSEPTHALLFLADRLDHLNGPNGFLPLLEAHDKAAVLSDRYALSSFAYQTSSAPEISFEWLFAIHRPAVHPHMTIFLDTPPAICLERLTTERGYHFEKYETLKTLTAVRERYLAAIAFLRTQGEFILVVNGEGTATEIHRRIRNRVAALLEGFTNVEKMRADDPWVDEVVTALEEKSLQIVGARLISGGMQLRVARGDMERSVFVNLFYAQGEPSKIIVQSPNAAVEAAAQAREALAPFYKALAKRRSTPKKPYLSEAQSLLKSAGFSIQEVSGKGTKVAIHLLSPEQAPMVVYLRYAGEQLKDISYEPEEPPQDMEAVQRYRRARQQAARALEPLIRLIQATQTPTLF